MLNRLPKNERIAVFGPSHAANHFMSSSPTGQPPQPNASIIGPVNWANFLLNGRTTLDMIGGIGINGDRTIADLGYPGMMARTINAINSGAGHIVMTAPTANDRNNMTAAQSIEALNWMIQRILKEGILLTILTDYPHGNAANTSMRLVNTAANPQLDNFTIVNRWLLSQNNIEGLRVIDTFAILGDFTSGFGQNAAGLFYDGLHMNQQGAYAVGRVLAAEWRRLYPMIAPLPNGSIEINYQPGVNKQPNLTKQPFFGGVAGTLGANCTGSLANDWQAPGMTDGTTAAYSKATTTSFGGRRYSEMDLGPMSKDWQQITFGGRATVSNEITVLRQTVNPAIGDLLRACAEIEVDPDSTGLAGVFLYVYHSVTNTTIRQFQVPTVAATASWPTASVAGVLRTPQWVADSTTCLVQIGIRPIANVDLRATLRVRGVGCGKSL